MGNCLCLHPNKVKGETEEIQEQQQAATEFKKESESKKGSIKVKIVLSKEDLEVLLLKVKNNGGKSLEEVLREVEKVRSEKVGAGWRPSLESIIEHNENEGAEMNRS